ncbi:hypothetical protein ACFQDN_20845 [Pseudomonas asuensis]|uniref:Uncharacterized protein n=1 Tax=Pseudomonas asuensis TaxID=1825787 RepID=A0ABQ2H2U4_9PSED|nr:hypothetical protein [Pseudomonas asuensis]GGM29808.1 hypothetical protein GCM10009425_45470 [Pseudomonas asuensis]
MKNDDGHSCAHILAPARDKIRRMQQSPRYHSFFNKEAIDAFEKVENSVLAGKSLQQDVCEDPGVKGKQ